MQRDELCGTSWLSLVDDPLPKQLKKKIVHPSQRGFVHGGSSAKSVDELLDAWDWSREGQREFYTLLYDIRQAYDSVLSPVLTRAMQRLRMPPAFVELIADSLSGLSSCVRTAYGISEPFEVQRSLRQGDPLAPLLFVVLMDGLHDGLECNPLPGQARGRRLRWRNGASAAILSLGYADDRAVLANTLPNPRVQNDWVHYFMSYNSLRLNHANASSSNATQTANRSLTLPLRWLASTSRSISLLSLSPQPSHPLPGRTAASMAAGEEVRCPRHGLHQARRTVFAQAEPQRAGSHAGRQLAVVARSRSQRLGAGSPPQLNGLPLGRHL